MIKSITFIAIVIFTVFSLHNSTFAREYYVSKFGSDRNNGSRFEPFRTIQAGVNVATAGDTIYVMQGIYNERIFINKTGSKEKYLRITNYNNEKVILDGTGLKTKSKAFTIGEYQNKYHSSYIWIEGFEIRNYPGHGIVSTPGSNHIVIKKVYTHHNKGNGIYMYPDYSLKPGQSGYHLIENCHAEFNLHHGIKIAGVGTIVRNCVCNDNNPSGEEKRDGCGLQVSDNNWNVTVIGGMFYRNNRQGIRCAAKNATIKNVECFDNIKNGIKVGSKARNILITYCISYNNHNRGLWISSEVMNINVLNSKFYENWQQGIKLSGIIKNVNIKNCAIFDNKYNGILITSQKGFLGYNNNILIENNKFYRNKQGSIKLESVKGVFIKSNKFYTLDNINKELLKDKTVFDITIEENQFIKPSVSSIE